MLAIALLSMQSSVAIPTFQPCTVKTLCSKLEGFYPKDEMVNYRNIKVMLIEVRIPNYYNVIKHVLSLERTLYSTERRTQGKSPPIDAVKCKQKIFFKCIGRSHRNRLLFRQLKLSTPLSCIIRMINEGRSGSKKGVARSLGGQHPLDTRALS